MSFLFKTTWFFCLFFLLSCYPPTINAPTQPQTGQQPVGGGQTTVIGQPSTGGGALPSRNDEDSSSVSNRRGSGCEDERSSHRCHKLCREMYSRDRDDCLDEDPDTIEDVYEVYQMLENARNLSSIDLSHFEAYLDISIISLTSLIRKYKRSDAEDMLIWIAEDSEVAELIRGEDDDFRVLNDLLSLMVRFDNTKLDVPFNRKINSRDNLMDYALKNGNEEALDYFFEYIFNGAKVCRNNQATVNCLTLICKIGRGNVERDRDYYFDSPVFENFMSEIIDKRVNGAASASGEKWIKGSGDNKIDSVSDLDYTWAGSEWDPSSGEMTVCGGL